jgi:outer membrane lipoprotein SlyB
MKKLIAAALMVAVAAPTALPVAASAQGYYHTYKGKDGRYHRVYRCKRSSGTTGAIAGAAGGGVAGAALIGGPVATIAGAVGGGLLGRHLDKKHDRAQNRRNGC